MRRCESKNGAKMIITQQTAAAELLFHTAPTMSPWVEIISLVLVTRANITWGFDQVNKEG